MFMPTSTIVSVLQWFLLFSSIHLLSLNADKCLRSDPQKCGNLTIPYPFRLPTTTCGLPGFEITCKGKSISDPGIPYLRTLSGEFQVLKISYDHLHILVDSTQFYALTCETKHIIFELSDGGPFRISEHNEFFAVGCNTYGEFRMSLDSEPSYSGSCVSSCQRSNQTSSRRELACKENGCCRIVVPGGYTKINFTTKFYHSDVEGNCSYSASAIVDQDSWDLIAQSKFQLQGSRYSMRLDWAIQNDTCSSAKANTSYQCAANAECKDREWGYVCKCKTGYNGDGYTNGTGCRGANCSCIFPALSFIFQIRFYSDDFIPCSRNQKMHGFQLLSNFINNHRYLFLGIQQLYAITPSGFTFPAIIVFCLRNAGVGGTLIAVLLGGGGLFWILKLRKSKRNKEKNFQRNGGDHLEKLISSRRGVEGMKLFSLKEIEKATNKFSQNLILGSGGYGTVYKGTLANGRLVAVKKSKQVDSKEIDLFINEVCILSQINHRNVVKLLGCCLETSVPLLVYEYVANGTLFDHLHGNKQQQRQIPWEQRLFIATETAEALSYLHSAASIPIVHRDVKSSNILLDNDYNPKVADFGVSRLVPMGQTHITTAVQGTLGYLDPEYFLTVQLTEKSDVYSLGVVLVELLTGLKPVSYERMKNGNLAIFFLSTVNTRDLREIIDPRLEVDEGKNMESMRRVAKLAEECLSLEGEKRPSMKEVVQELLWSKVGERPHAWLTNDVADNPEEMVELTVDEEERQGIRFSNKEFGDGDEDRQYF